MHTLTPEETTTLQRNRCTAEDWQLISVSEGFNPNNVYDTHFFGKCKIGETGGKTINQIGLPQHAGIRNARIANSTIGDNCIIENVSGFISDTHIGNNCQISNIGTIRTEGDTRFGLFRKIAVLNEAGEGNILFCPHLTSQVAALMAIPGVVSKETKEKLFSLAKKDTENYFAAEGIEGIDGTKVKTTVCDNTVILNTQEITNSYISSGTCINGARIINECAFFSSADAPVKIGNGVILNGCVATFGSKITDNVIASNCFVGECATLTDGFSATDSVFFANSFMANGEACAAFCGPFTVSHHKSTLLIGGMFSFYNAGSATNYSNHAYKMGPIHWGTMEQGSKTASSAHILWPANIGYFSMCMGKIANHPDTTAFPFSYLIGDGKETWLVPAHSIATVGTFRDIKKWPKRDQRPLSCRFTNAGIKWMHPGIAVQVLKGKENLEAIACNLSETNRYTIVNGCQIKRSSIEKGIKLYELYLQMYLSECVTPDKYDEALSDRSIELALNEYEEEQTEYSFTDLAGTIVSRSVLEWLENELNDDNTIIESISNALANNSAAWAKTGPRAYNLAVKIAEECFGISRLPFTERCSLLDNCKKAWNEWIELIHQDAEKEYSMGDVDRETLDDFLNNTK